MLILRYRVIFRCVIICKWEFGRGFIGELFKEFVVIKCILIVCVFGRGIL